MHRYIQGSGGQLAKIAGVDIEKHAMAMFEAGTNFSKKTKGRNFLSGFQDIQSGRY